MSSYEQHVLALTHLAGVSLTAPEQVTRDAALLLAQRAPVRSLELTDRPKEPGQCNVDDLGVRFTPGDHVVDGLDELAGDDSVFRNVVLDLLHDSSPAVAGLNNSTVGEGRGSGAEASAPEPDATNGGNTA